MDGSEKTHNRTTLSVGLFLAFLAIVIWTVAALRRGDIHTASVRIAWALASLSAIGLATWPTECRVISYDGEPCTTTVYGFLFGCLDDYHWWPKFFARIGMQKDALRRIDRHKPERQREAAYQCPPEGEPVRVKIDDDGLTLCGFWVSVVSAVAAVIQVITIFTIHH